MKANADWAYVRNVLCIRLDNMGDVLMTTPAIRALRASGRRRRITLMASTAGAQLAPYLPEVDDTLIYDAAWVKNGARGHSGDCAAIERLRNRHFDAAVIFTVYSQSALPAALMCHLAGIPRVLAHSRENPYRLLSHWVRDTEPEEMVRHEVQRQLDLVASVGMACANTRLSFETRDTDRASTRKVLHAHGVGATQGWIVMHCGATAQSRRYDAGAFSETIGLLRDSGRPVLMTGSASERQMIDNIISASPWDGACVNLAGKLRLGELGCVIEDADLLISNNTGPVHIAAAVQTPVVDLYALTNPQHTPWQVRHRLLYCDVPCKYCYRSVCPHGHNACLNGVAPATVARAAYEMLAVGGTATRTALPCVKGDGGEHYVYPGH